MFSHIFAPQLAELLWNCLSVILAFLFEIVQPSPNSFSFLDFHPAFSLNPRLYSDQSSAWCLRRVSLKYQYQFIKSCHKMIKHRDPKNISNIYYISYSFSTSFRSKWFVFAAPSKQFTVKLNLCTRLNYFYTFLTTKCWAQNSKHPTSTNR